MTRERKTQNAHLVPAIPLGLALTLLFGAGSAQALTPVLTPVDPADGCAHPLSTPGGGEYILTGDLDCSGTNGNGVNITASNVVFHLAGHTISSTDCDLTQNISGIFVQGGISGVRIDGGKVSGFNDGILLQSSDSRVEGMTVTKACAFGIAGQGQNNRIERNVVTASGDGVALVPSKNTRVTSNDLSGNVRAGVAISDFADNNIVENNILNNNGSTGEGHGVAIFLGTNNTIRNNVANKNDVGIRLGSAVNQNGDPMGNRAIGNTVSGNAHLGIWIEKEGGPSTVKRNTVLGSGETDMVDESAGCDGNTWRNNTFQTDLVIDVSDGGPGVGCIQ